MSILVTVSTLIEADAEEVWNVLLDFDRYPEWSLGLRIQGAPVVGEKLRVGLGGGTGGIRPTVVTVDPMREFAWLGRLGLPRIIDGRHFFRLAPSTGGATEFTHGEVYSGLLVTVLKPFLRGQEQGTQYESFNVQLKRRVETLAGGSGRSRRPD